MEGFGQKKVGPLIKKVVGWGGGPNPYHFFGVRSLFGIGDGPHFPDYRDFDLPGILHFFFDFLRNVER